MNYWRQVSRDKIREVVERVGLEDRTRLKTELFKAYPFGMRNYYPYKIWLDEIKKHLPKEADPPPGDQMKLFGPAE